MGDEAGESLSVPARIVAANPLQFYDGLSARRPQCWFGLEPAARRAENPSYALCPRRCRPGRPGWGRSGGRPTPAIGTPLRVQDVRGRCASSGWVLPRQLSGKEKRSAISLSQAENLAKSTEHSVGRLCCFCWPTKARRCAEKVVRRLGQTRRKICPSR